MADDVKWKLTVEEQQAVSAFKRLWDAEDAVDREILKFDGHVQKAGQSAALGAGLAGSAFSGLKSIISNATSTIAGFVTSALSISSVTRATREYNEELKLSVELQKQMKEVAILSEQQALKIANLPGRADVSKQGIAKVNDVINSISYKTSIPRDIVSSLLFYAESSLGSTPSGKSAAEEIARFSGPAGLTSEEVSQIPKVFNLTGADTPEKQRLALAKLYKAAGSSIASTGQFLSPFTNDLANYINRGFSYEQLLARYTSAIDVTGSVAEAGEMTRRLASIATGRNEKAMEFLTKEAKREGIDFTKLSDPERVTFTETLWDKYSSTGKRDKFKTEMDSRGYEAMLALFSPQAKKKYTEILEATKTADVDPLNRMFDDYQKTLMAGKTRGETLQQARETSIGNETSGAASFNTLIESLQRDMKSAPMSFWQRARLALTPSSFEQRNIADQLVFQTLSQMQVDAAKQYGWDSEEVKKIQSLSTRYDNTQILRDNPELLNEIWDTTRGFTNGRSQKDYGGDPYYSAIQKALESGNRITSDGLSGIVTEIKQQTKILTEAADAMKSAAAAMKSSKKTQTNIAIVGGE